MECNARNRRKLWHAAFSGSAHFFMVVKLFSLPSHASCGRKERRGRLGLRLCLHSGRKGCVGFAFGRRGLARGPKGGESGKACCGQRSCTCRGVLEYLPQSTRMLCGKHCEALRTAPRRTAHFRARPCPVPVCSHRRSRRLRPRAGGRHRVPHGAQNPTDHLFLRLFGPFFCVSKNLFLALPDNQSTETRTIKTNAT